MQPMVPFMSILFRGRLKKSCREARNRMLNLEMHNEEDAGHALG